MLIISSIFNNEFKTSLIKCAFVNNIIIKLLKVTLLVIIRAKDIRYNINIIYNKDKDKLIISAFYKIDIKYIKNKSELINYV